MTQLPDLPARVRALTDLESTLLVEAAAGTGKTALIAGRVAVALTRGIAPEHIAAITFSELAASQLSARIHEFVTGLLAGSKPECLEPVFTNGLSTEERGNLAEGHRRIDELTVTTIHGLCQRIIHSYAVEADIDPGARMMDAPASNAAFRMVFQHWLRERLTTSSGRDDAIVAMSEGDPLDVERRLWELAEFRRRYRTARPIHADLTQRLDLAFETSVERFSEWLSRQPEESGTLAVVDDLAKLAQFYSGCLASPPDFRELWRLSMPPPLACRNRVNLNLNELRQKGAWQRVAGKAEGARLAAEADVLFAAVNDAYRNLLGEIATAMVEVLSGEMDAMLNRYDNFKRHAAVLDFDDLLHRAHRLVTRHEQVRQALGKRYQRILVDEFQDTDPIQAEILFRIAAVRLGARWQDSALRPGSLFVVGDPKQAIYRFRGADIHSYNQAKAAIYAQWPDNILRITANFRCVPAIIDYINTHFDAALNGADQPGYVALASTRCPTAHGLPCVAKVSLDLAPESRVAEIRASEATAVAAVCERLIRNLMIPGADGALVPLRPADIALLAPATTQLRGYERALELKGLPFASGAGKALLHRQEVQDLLAIARTLAVPSDTLSFGALMRGPIVGLTEEELLDITASLDVHADDPEAMPRFTIHTEPEKINHPLAREILTILRDLRSRVRATTPALLLAEAVERLAMRPILFIREGNERARAAANIERFLELAREYDVLGLARFVHDMTNEWAGTVNERQEGRVDAEGAIDIVTMHSSKGLEWPVVILINSASAFRPQDEFVHRPEDDTLHWRLGEIEPPVLTQALDADNRIWSSERQRVWYVACTRARELLVLPEIPATARPTWAGVVDDIHRGVPELPLPRVRPRQERAEASHENPQTAEIFAREEDVVRRASRKITWRRPSDADPDLLHTEPKFVVDETEAPENPETPAPAGAGRLRGLLLHKLIEEVLSGETPDDPAALTARAEALTAQLTGDTTGLPDVSELAQTIVKTLALPDITLLRPQLVAEFPLYNLQSSDAALTAMAGRADAVAFDGTRVSVVIDWKSDIAPDAATIAAHAAQLSEYLLASYAARGALIYMTPGIVHWVN